MFLSILQDKNNYVNNISLLYMTKFIYINIITLKLIFLLKRNRILQFCIKKKYFSSGMGTRWVLGGLDVSFLNNATGRGRGGNAIPAPNRSVAMPILNWKS